MQPLNTHDALWLARGEALATIVRLLQRGLRASANRLRNSRLAHRLWQFGLARQRLPEG